MGLYLIVLPNPNPFFFYLCGMFDVCWLCGALIQLLHSTHAHILFM